ncbi:MAG TPA: mechanosensitive ion channel family protein, partial [Dermatophilaceae bacterium]|nr:mechanosensitive ion channel family protein [Dermatophilaceae bacterium]
MSFAPLTTDPHTSLPGRDALGNLSKEAVADWWWLIGPALTIVGTLVGAVLLRWALHRAIDRVVDNAMARAARRENQSPRRASRILAQATGSNQARRSQRAATTGAILKSTSTFVIFAMALLTVMAALGLPLGPLLASAGVVGVALGFGAQSLVKDFLSGIFMMLEDQYGVGDVIDTGEAIGTVEDVTLRVTKVRDASGIVWYIRNGEIIRVGNRSQGWSTAVVDIQVGYHEKLDIVLPLIREVARELDAAPEWTTRLLEEPEVAGVESMTGGVVTIRIIAKCAPNENFPVSREIRGRVKTALDAAGIRAPQLMPPIVGE